MSKLLLFIPFAAKENNFSLYLRALEWRHSIRQAGKEDKIPDVVVYRQPDEEDGDYEDYDVHFRFNSDNCPSDCTIYVLADGCGDPTRVININKYFYQRREEPYFLAIKTIAQRMKFCGLSAELASRVKAIKLFICDPNNSNKQLAINFAHELGARYNDITLQYYNAVLYSPKFSSNNPKSHKRAEVFPQNSNSVKPIESRRASEYRRSITVSTALQKQMTNIPTQHQSLSLVSLDGEIQISPEEDFVSDVLTKPPHRIECPAENGFDKHKPEGSSTTDTAKEILHSRNYPNQQM
ncbi:hypothetical protein EAS68_05160 [Legionella jordanis]|uniref:hypothetical protein n=1 Tax=Legionella jordanis TaxID=456 RepID=UPI000EFDD036|nr:hypothetical protein [Legionella jordanis]RMX21096.1 hypothetical protein EAS68_05160 [Legionella jordanis]